MRKLISRMINFLLLICLVICFIGIFNKEKENLDIDITSLNEVENKTYQKQGMIYVGLAICSDASSDFTQGDSNVQENFGHHSWLSITNLGTVPIIINGIEIPVLGTITLGTWQSEIHDGIFYNAERYYAEKSGFSEIESAYKVILLNEFELNYLISLISAPSNDSWSIINNCSSFAEKIWNKLADEKVNAGIIKCPIKLYESILKVGGNQGLIISSPNTEIYYGGKKPVQFEL